MTLDPQSPHLRPSPPVAARPIPRELLPPEFQSVLRRLEQRYGAALHINVTDAKWVEITVENLPAALLTVQLQQERRELFGVAEPRMQVIAPLRPMGNAIYLHLLTEPEWSNPRSMMMSALKMTAERTAL